MIDDPIKFNEMEDGEESEIEAEILAREEHDLQIEIEGGDPDDGDEEDIHGAHPIL